MIKTENKRVKLNEKISFLEKRIKKIKSLESVPLRKKKRTTYNEWNNFANSENGQEILKPFLNEKEYLTWETNIMISAYKMNLDLLDCEENGHSEGISIKDGRNVNYTCERCGGMYERPMNAEENNSWDKMLRTPMNI